MDKTVLGNDLKIHYLDIGELKPCEYNPRKFTDEAVKQLTESITKYGVVDPLVVNAAEGRKNIVIGGNMRFHTMKKMGIKSIPVVFVNIPNLEREKELNLRLNKNVGEFDLALLAEFDESLLKNVGFSSEEMDQIFDIGDENHEIFDLEKELDKLDIKKISVKKGDIFQWSDGSRVMCGDSMIEADMLKLMDGERADMCFTDPPYILDYLKGKTKQKDGVTKGFGAKKNRIYLGTESLPDNFTELWIGNVAKVQKPDFSIMVFEHPKNLRTVWNELEKYWKYRNTITWHIPNRVQGFAAKYKFFNKQDIALVGTGGDVSLNLEVEDDVLFQNEYENALFATSGKPHWESYKKGKRVCPTDFIEHIAADEKSSGQGIIFGTKPLPILIPYIKVLTRRGDLVLEPFGGSGSTAAAAAKLKRRFRLMEKSPVYTEVILKRLEKIIGSKPEKI